MNTKKLIAVVGPTASGKSALAVQLAKDFNGEIISADSRQVYKGMDIGSGKITKKEMRGIPHHLLDVALPKQKFTVAQYQKSARAAISKILKGGKIPVICGGTGFYVQSVVDGIVIPEVKPNWKLRKKLEKKSTAELYKILKKSDPERAKNIERQNPRRLIRAIEIVMTTRKPVPKLNFSPPPYATLLIGINKPKKRLKNLIAKRLKKRLASGMIAEIKKLKRNVLSWKRLEEFGLEYRWVARYLQKNISKKEMVNKLQKDIEHFAKRQMTWFLRDKRIKWIKNYKEAKKITKKFLR